MSSIENDFEDNDELDFYEETYDESETQQPSQPYVFVFDSNEIVDDNIQILTPTITTTDSTILPKKTKSQHIIRK